MSWKWLASGQGCWGPRPLQVDSEYKLYASRFYCAGLCGAVEKQDQALRQMDGLGGACRENTGRLRPKMRLCGWQGDDTLVTKLGCSVG